MEASAISAAAAGDRSALAAIVDEFMPTVLGAAFGLCGDWDLAADIAQEAFATMLVRLADLREPAALPGWLMAVTRTAARRQRGLRAAAVPVEGPDVAGPHVAGPHVAGPHVAGRHVAGPHVEGLHVEGPEDIVVARTEARRLRRAVEALPADQRVPVVLHYFAGHRLADIAELCGLPLSTVKKRMRVARARLREETPNMADNITACTRPDPGADPSDAIRIYTAMRSGDLARVAELLDARPDLVNVREGWTRAESFAHRLPWTRGGGTPVLRAVERGDTPMVRLLLSRGADPNGSCTCAGGESPLWVAVAQHETDIAEVLLHAGASPNVTAFAGASPLDVARIRGYHDLEALLAAHGATPSEQRPFPAAAEVGSAATGIKAIDLWCPLPQRGLVSLTPGFGLGAMVLLAELSHRAVRAGRSVVWTGFVQAPTDLGDIHHGLAESAITDQVQVSLAAPTASAEEQAVALDRGIRLAGDDALLIVLAETGHLHAVDERLLELAQRPAVTIIVAPLDGSVAPPQPTGSPYLASIAFDLDRARRGLWPAISAESWSKVAHPSLAAFADRARSHPSDALDRYLAQPFYVAEHVTGAPGQTVTPDELSNQLAEQLL